MEYFFNVPAFADSYRTIQNEQSALSAGRHTLDDYFQKQGFTVSGNDPDEDSGEPSHNIYVNPYDEEQDKDSYVSICVDRTGIIRYIRYYIYLDIDKEKLKICVNNVFYIERVFHLSAVIIDNQHIHFLPTTHIFRC